jgi:hypothetical protein
MVNQTSLSPMVYELPLAPITPLAFGLRWIGGGSIFALFRRLEMCFPG